MTELFYWTEVRDGAVVTAWPCPGPITSYWGAKDMEAHQSGHSGVDIGAPEGTPVYAPCESLVRDVFAIGIGRDDWEAVFGNSVILEHEGYVSLYAHLRDAPAVHEGETVHQGTLLGYVGSTGQSTGPHLHWGMAPALFNGEPSYLPREACLDPLTFCRDQVPLPQGEFVPEPDATSLITDPVAANIIRDHEERLRALEGKS